MKKIFNSRKAFTLIELLVVIAVLGILAIAIVAAINPLQKIKQAKDSTIKTDIAQISNAMGAFYTTSASGGVAPSYPTSVAALVSSNDLKVEPKQPGGTTSYSVGCTASCTEQSVYAPLNAPTATGDYWCWRSTAAVASEVGSAATSCAP